MTFKKQTLTAHNWREPGMTMYRIAEVVDEKRLRLKAAYFNTQAGDGPLMGYVVETGQGQFETCNCGEITKHNNWKDAVNHLPFLLVDAEETEEGDWEEVDYGGMHEVRELVWLYGPAAWTELMNNRDYRL